MVFKLVRIDSEEPCKIQLPIGTHLFGRGKFLDCDDKRVSRKHGEFEVTGDGVSVKALHSNPCFYTKKGTEETQVLKLDSSVDLCHGDKFGLLPNSFWYEVLYCSELDSGRSPEITQDDTQPLQLTPVTVTKSNNNGLDDTNDVRERPFCDMDQTVSSSQRPESPSLMLPVVTVASPSYTPKEASPTKKPSPSKSETEDQPIQVEPSSDMNPPSPVCPKRSHSPESSKDEVKKVKEEPADAEPDVRPGTSADQGGSNQTKDNNAFGGPPSPAKPPTGLGRERCYFGANCYRKNPQHKADYAHPHDSDWGSGDRKDCPYGSGCRKWDPRHWRAHTHPPHTPPPPPPPAPAQNRKTPKRRYSKSDSSEDDDTPEASLIVTGKRPRKTIRRPSYSGSELDEDEDPYGTDGEDDWEPGSQSQYSQDTPN